MITIMMIMIMIIIIINNNTFILHYERNVIFRIVTFRNDFTKMYRLYVT